MLIVRVELHSAITGKVTEIARMKIANTGNGTEERGDYDITTFRGRTAQELDRGNRQRGASITNWPRLNYHVWHLVVRALLAVNYRMVLPR